MANQSTSIHCRAGTSNRPQRTLPHGVATRYWLSSQITNPNGPRGAVLLTHDAAIARKIDDAGLYRDAGVVDE